MYEVRDVNTNGGLYSASEMSKLQGAVYDRAVRLKSTKYARSMTAPTVETRRPSEKDFVILNKCVSQALARGACRPNLPVLHRPTIVDKPCGTSVEFLLRSEKHLHTNRIHLRMILGHHPLLYRYPCD